MGMDPGDEAMDPWAMRQIRRRRLSGRAVGWMRSRWRWRAATTRNRHFSRFSPGGRGEWCSPRGGPAPSPPIRPTTRTPTAASSTEQRKGTPAGQESDT
eukprot:767399-Prorocentrum_minimum.AAC.1